MLLVFHLYDTNMPAKVCSDDARVEAVCGDAGVAQTAAQLPAEEYVGQLGLQGEEN